MRLYGYTYTSMATILCLYSSLVPYTGIRLLSLNGQTDLQESSSIGHRNDIIDIMA